MIFVISNKEFYIYFQNFNIKINFFINIVVDEQNRAFAMIRISGPSEILLNDTFKKGLNFRYQKGVFTGSMGDIFETMRKLMNFTFSALPSTDGFYGAKVGFPFNGTVSPDFELTEVFKNFSSHVLPKNPFKIAFKGQQ